MILKRYSLIGLLTFTLLPFAGCKSGKGVSGSEVSKQTGVVESIVLSRVGSHGIYPDATIFKMSGDYADNVAVTLNPDGTLAYYPAPGDLSSVSVPYALGNGWYLNRQGISSGSVFTKWTFQEYMALPQPPTTEQIKAAIIPGAYVTEMETIPVKIGEAMADPSICIKYAK